MDKDTTTNVTGSLESDRFEQSRDQEGKYPDVVLQGGCTTVLALDVLDNLIETVRSNEGEEKSGGGIDMLAEDIVLDCVEQGPVEGFLPNSTRNSKRKDKGGECVRVSR